MRRAIATLAGLLSLAIPGATFAADGAPEPVRATGGPAAEAWGVSGADTALMREQQPLVAAAQTLQAAIGDHRDFTSLGLEPPGLFLYWKGTPPATITAAIKRLGVPVRVVLARYSNPELRAASDQIKKTIEAGKGNGVHAIDVLVDGSGLRLGVDPPGSGNSIAGRLPIDPNAEPTDAQKEAAAQAVRTAGVSVPFTVGIEPRVEMTSRENDFAPWAGGIVVVNRGPSPYSGQGCTGGFGVRSQVDNRTYLVTMSHCGYVGDVVRDPTGELIGLIRYRHPDQGVVLVSASSVSGEIYTGGGVGKPQSIKKVAGWTAPVYGMAVCTSGAVTGNQCGLTVNHVSGAVRCGSEPYEQFKCWGPLVGIRRTDGALAGRNGDSGGPVYYPNGTRVTIVGVIHGGHISDPAWLWIVGANMVRTSFDGVDPDPADDAVNLNLAIVVKY
jgi:streptogrisin D